MRVLAWNSRGIRSPSTVSQLRESLWELRTELVFISEIKRKKGFVGSVYKKLGFKNRWYVENPIGKSAGLLLGWSKDVTIHQIISSGFSIEVELEPADTKGKIWAVFVYTSNKEKEHLDQWHEL